MHRCDVMLDIQNGVPKQEALAKRCSSHSPSICDLFYDNVDADNVEGELTKKLFTKAVKHCQDYGAAWMSTSMSRKNCYKLGVTDADMPELASFDPQNGNWD